MSVGDLDGLGIFGRSHCMAWDGLWLLDTAGVGSRIMVHCMETMEEVGLYVGTCVVIYIRRS